GCGEYDALLDELDLKLLNVGVAHSERPWREHVERYRRMAEANPARYAWCTTFELPGFDDPDYADRVVDQLRRDFDDGAVACKIWKNVGMELRDPAGRFVQMDHPVFEPIYELLSKLGKGLLMHMAEPIGCWQPLDERNIHRVYFAAHPEWHMYGKEGVPSHAEIIAARDRVVDRYPKVPFIGAHLGSLEHDLRGIADRLDRWPNFAVDSCRLYDMTFMDRDALREFLIAYSDRVICGTDLMSRTPVEELPDDDRQRFFQRTRASADRERRFYEADEPVDVDGHQARGLALPEEVAAKILHANAERWYPGI
ncbi:MAG: amidohydrolase family protein, partial [Planctomycetota bacterium]